MKQHEKWKLLPEVREILDNCKSYIIPDSREELLEIAMGGKGCDYFEVSYDVPGLGKYVEATVVRCKNGASVNYTTPYMRRRDPDCMLIADDLPTDKETYQSRYKKPFSHLRNETFQWLKQQHLLLMPFYTGKEVGERAALLIAPSNAGFFAGGLGDLQGMIPASKVPIDYEPVIIIYLAPPFRHTHFNGKQMVVHNRRDDVYEIFSYNLYPGPSAKKGIYGMLISLGEREGWLTLHGSTVQLVTPYDNITTIMHEGASGGGKSEMIEYAHRTVDGRFLLGVNTITKEEKKLTLNQACTILPVTDDMALCPPNLQNDGKLVVTDAENAWFVRVNHITHYGTDPNLENLTIHAKEPLIFLNIDGVKGATALIWEHTIDEDTKKPCPNPRVILPRRLVPNIVNQPVEVDIRSFGIRTPVCTKERPTYGIVGYLHILPPALAWLWRLVAPRGDANPSIVAEGSLSSEGVGSYWPFATGKRVAQANLLLRQIVSTPKTRYILCPNQHVGAWKVSFMPQWIAREYLARKGTSKFRPDQLTPARCPLLGYTLVNMQVEGYIIPQFFLEVHKQPEVTEEGYDKGAQILYNFFRRELEKFYTDELDELGKTIIKAFFENKTVEDFGKIIPSEL